MPKKIMDTIPEPLRDQLRAEVIEELKSKGWSIAQAPEKKNETEMDQTIAEWAKQNKSANPNEWSKNY